MKQHKSYSYKILDNVQELEGKVVIEIIETDNYILIITNGTILIYNVMRDVVKLSDIDSEIIEALEEHGIKQEQLI